MVRKMKKLSARNHDKSEHLILRTRGKINQSIKEKEKQSMPWELKDIIEVLHEDKKGILHNKK